MASLFRFHVGGAAAGSIRVSVFKPAEGKVDDRPSQSRGVEASPMEPVLVGGRIVLVEPHLGVFYRNPPRSPPPKAVAAGPSDPFDTILPWCTAAIPLDMVPLPPTESARAASPENLRWLEGCTTIDSPPCSGFL